MNRHFGAEYPLVNDIDAVVGLAFVNGSMAVWRV
jgi:hypothetical protein